MHKMKKIIIDGHNLIPKIPGMKLSDSEDENALVEVINEYCRLSRTQAELFFDGAPAPGYLPKKSGLVNVHFIRKELSADDAIINYIRQHHRPNYLLTVISSDHRIQNAVRSLGTEVLSSEAFYAEMQRVFSSPAAAREKKERTLSESELQFWLDEFETRQSRQNNS